MSKIIRAMTRDGSARALVTDSKTTVSRGMELHHTEPTASAAFGRVLTAASLMGSLMPEVENLITLRFKGDGTGGTILVSGDYLGNVRGFIQNPYADPPLKPNGKLDVAGCVGKGKMFVIRKAGDGEPYIGISDIKSGEIAEDITAYYAESEQIPTVCALGVLVDTDRTCLAAGGALIQLLPGADTKITDILEKNIEKIPPITELLCRHSLEEILGIYLEGIEYDIFDSMECGYVCECSREKTDAALASLPPKDLEEMINGETETEVTCQFCDQKYAYTKEDLLKLRRNRI